MRSMTSSEWTLSAISVDFGQLQLQPLRVEAGVVQRPLDEGRQVGVRHLDRGEIDRDAEALLPGGGVDTGLPEHPFADLGDQSAFLGQRNEVAGRDEAALAMAQRSSASNP